MKVKLRDLTKEQYHKWSEKNCINGVCISCPFHHVNCSPTSTMSWFYSKETFSDKFLDQEVEIEDEPLLTKEEKNYLENVVKPFKDRLKYIIKCEIKEYKHLTIIVKTALKNVIFETESIVLPMFEDNEYYKNLVVDKEYTLEELGLFENE